MTSSNQTIILLNLLLQTLSLHRFHTLNLEAGGRAERDQLVSPQCNQFLTSLGIVAGLSLAAFLLNQHFEAKCGEWDSDACQRICPCRIFAVLEFHTQVRQGK